MMEAMKKRHVRDRPPFSETDQLSAMLRVCDAGDSLRVPVQIKPLDSSATGFGAYTRKDQFGPHRRANRAGQNRPGAGAVALAFGLSRFS
jgi:hypothetical protein